MPNAYISIYTSGSTHGTFEEIIIIDIARNKCHFFISEAVSHARLC